MKEQAKKDLKEQISNLEKDFNDDDKKNILIKNIITSLEKNNNYKLFKDGEENYDFIKQVIETFIEQRSEEEEKIETLKHNLKKTNRTIYNKYKTDKVK